MRQFSKPILLFAFLILLLDQSSAQDPRFSQFYASPWNLNPAMTGLFNGRWRVTANYRDQWSSFLNPVPFRTYAAAFDARFEVGRDDYAAFGIGAMHDEAGTARFVQNKAQIGGAFLKQLTGGRYRAQNYLSAGAQLGLGQNSIDWSRLWFSRQFDSANERPNTDLSNGEPNANANSKAYLDFNAGLLWYVLFGTDGFLYAGGALHHINSPAISLNDDDQETLYSRWSGHAGGQFPLTDNFSALPGVLVMKQGPAFETDFGVNFRYSNNDLNELALRAGAWARLGNKLDSGLQMDAITIVGMLELNRWTLGLSYDITTSSLTAANNSRGAFEISLSYFHPGERRARIVCPNF
ncbi:MAG: PorP/SprF family type IX secretion system membrane protein [Saprospiraceae bacterium]|nr:PorP/SprF family type IX secretion system membrane protein [Saprospiraceae bacterium]MCW5922041.1 PorP/SprF family type IX secretion system membrane protein [Saprospiraceae bacterium]